MSDKVNLHPVNSSSIDSIGFDPQAQELHIKFATGSYYIYREVTMHTYEQFRAAPSVGKFFAKNIRSVYDGEKV
jgi:hypothetical protein